MLEENRQNLRIWCAACSTGQEPYSLAMMLDDNPRLTGGRPVEIVATDISTRVLEKAKAGLYSQFEVQRGLPIQMLMKYFHQKDDLWQLSDRIRSKVTFKEFNLMEEPRAFGQFDVIFCRNVLIYFDAATKSKVLDNLSRIMRPNSYLLLGAAETVIGVTKKFEATKERRGLYQLTSQAASGAIRAA